MDVTLVSCVLCTNIIVTVNIIIIISNIIINTNIIIVIANIIVNANIIIVIIVFVIRIIKSTSGTAASTVKVVFSLYTPEMKLILWLVLYSTRPSNRLVFKPSCNERDINCVTGRNFQETCLVLNNLFRSTIR
jgi:hypothetical protein